MAIVRGPKNTGNTAPIPPLTEGIRPEHRALAERIVSRMGGSEDAVQEVMIAAWRCFSSYDPTAAIVGIARNVLANQRRKAARHCLADGAVVESEEPDAPDAAYDRKSQAANVRAALEEVPEPYRSILWRADANEEPMSAIAADIGCNVNTGHTRLRLARSLFRAAVRRHAAKVR